MYRRKGSIEFYLASKSYKNRRKGFEMLFKAHYERMLARAIRLLHDEEIAKDVIHKFLKNKMEKDMILSKEPIENIINFLYKIIYRECLNEIKRRKNKEDNKKEYIERNKLNGDSNIETRLIKLQNRELLKKCLLINSNEETLRYYELKLEGYERREIMEKMELEGKDYKRIIKKLVNGLKKCGFDIIKGNYNEI